MTFDLFLSPCDAARARRVMDKLALHDIRGFALTGSLALEIGLIGLGHTPRARALNDVDLVVESFSGLPETLADTFLFRHIHPRAPEGKTLVQLVDRDERVRIDVFRAYGATMSRSQPVRFTAGAIPVVSIEDLAARAASLVMDLERSTEVPLKHARDFQRLADAIDRDRIETAWREHRRVTDPATFEEASGRIRHLIQTRANLLTIPDYSHDADAVCAKCQETGPFRLASPQTILSILGYC